MKEGKQFEVLKWAVVIVILFVIYKVLNKIGLIKTASEEKAEKEQEAKVASITTNWYWNSNVIPPTGVKVFQGWKDKTQPDKFAKIIWDAIGGLLSDNEEAIYGVFRKLVAQSQVMHIARSFQKTYGEDLGLKLKAVLSPEEMVTVIDIIEKKPKGLSYDGKKFI